MSYDAVLFDMDGVLLSGYQTDPSVYREASERVLTAYRDDVEHDSADVESLVPHDDFLGFCTESGLPVDDLWERRERISCELENEQIANGERPPFDDAAVIDELAASTGIVSNNRQATVDFVVEYFDLAVDVAYGRSPTLDGYERRKPASHYLDLALAELDVRPSDALFVGDRRSDVLTAHDAGADAALLARDGVPSGSPKPEFVVETLLDLPVELSSATIE